jgi:hypothetical protein
MKWAERCEGVLQRERRRYGSVGGLEGRAWDVQKRVKWDSDVKVEE